MAGSPSSVPTVTGTASVLRYVTSCGRQTSLDGQPHGDRGKEAKRHPSARVSAEIEPASTAPRAQRKSPLTRSKVVTARTASTDVCFVIGASRGDRAAYREHGKHHADGRFDLAHHNLLPYQVAAGLVAPRIAATLGRLVD